MSRFGKGAVVAARAATALRLAYADPPYPGLAKRYYQGRDDYAGEVNHRELLSRLQEYDGWALSTSARALPQVLAEAVAQDLTVRVAAWFRGPRKVPSTSPVASWEPVVYAGGRHVLAVAADVRSDSLIYFARPRLTEPDRPIGTKPAAFVWWMFQLLGAAPGDSFDDLYPGSGGIGRAWQLYTSRGAGIDPSQAAAADTSSGPGDDASPVDARQLALPSCTAVHDSSEAP